MVHGCVCGTAVAAGAGVGAGGRKRLSEGRREGGRWGDTANVAGAANARMGVGSAWTGRGGRGGGGEMQHGPHVSDRLLAGVTRRRARWGYYADCWR